MLRKGGQMPWKMQLSWAIIFALLAVVPFPLVAEAEQPTRDEYLTLVKSGWIFDLHASRMRRHPGLPPVRFNSTEIAQSEICLIGAPPRRHSRQIIMAFAALLHDVYGHRLTVTFAGPDIRSCPERQRIYVRLYEGRPPATMLNRDIQHLDRAFDIRFPTGWTEPVRSPAQTNGFFGHRGPVAHIFVSQPHGENLTPLQRDYFSSILIEELFQVVSFGADILKFDKERPFFSKLQERPINLRYLPWDSEQFMRGLLSSNPSGLCGFDFFMLHALAQSQLEMVNSDELIPFIDANFDALRARAQASLASNEYGILSDQTCLTLPD